MAIINLQKEGECMNSLEKYRIQKTVKQNTYLSYPEEEYYNQILNVVEQIF